MLPSYFRENLQASYFAEGGFFLARKLSFHVKPYLWVNITELLSRKRKVGT